MDGAGRSLYFGRDDSAEQTDAERTPPSKKHCIKRKGTDTERNSPSKRHCIERKRYSSIEENVKTQVDIIRQCNSWTEKDLIAARQAIYELTDVLDENRANSIIIVENGAIPALIQHLWGPPDDDDRDGRLQTIEHEAAAAAVALLQRLALKDSYRVRIIVGGALICLLTLLERLGSDPNDSSVNIVLHRVADAIKDLVDANDFTKDHFRAIGGIPTLVDLLQSTNTMVKRATASALLVLTHKNNENKNKIIECNPLPTLVYMIRHEDDQVRNYGVKLIEIMVSSSRNVRQQALIDGALQPIIDLLSDTLPENRLIAARLVAYYAEEMVMKGLIAQRGAIKPLANMLTLGDEQLQEPSSYALRLLSDNPYNAVAIISGVLRTLLDRLQSKSIVVQANVAYTLKRLSSSKDNVYDIVTADGYRKLRHGKWYSEEARDYVAQTLRNLKENMYGISLARLASLLHLVPPRGPTGREVRIQVALALAHLCSDPESQRRIFVSKQGKVLEELIRLSYAGSSSDRQDAAAALYALATKDPAAPHPAAPPKDVVPEVYLGEDYVNCITLADVTFIVEGKPFYAHKNALRRASDAFRVMFESGYRETNSDQPIEIRNISWRVFELMMRYIYTGTVEIPLDAWQDVLIAADQYLLEGLKHLCAVVIVQDITTENVAQLYEVAESCNAISLMQSCILFILQHAKQMCSMPGYCDLIMRIVPRMREYLRKILPSRV